MCVRACVRACVRVCVYQYIDFFEKKGLCTMSYRELFDFVTDLNITDRNMQAYLDKVSALFACMLLQWCNVGLPIR